MPRGLMILLLFLVTAGTSLGAAVVAWRVAAEQDEPGQWAMGLTGAAVLMNVILLANALGFVGQGEIALAEGASPAEALEEQIWLLVGTGGLMALVAMALDVPAVRDAPSPGIAVGRAYSAIIERLLVRFWWAALGLGLAFGIRARGVALLLAVELTLVWGIGKLVERWGHRV